MYISFKGKGYDESKNSEKLSKMGVKENSSLVYIYRLPGGGI